MLPGRFHEGNANIEKDTVLQNYTVQFSLDCQGIRILLLDAEKLQINSSFRFRYYHLLSTWSTKILHKTVQSSNPRWVWKYRFGDTRFNKTHNKYNTYLQIIIGFNKNHRISFSVMTHTRIFKQLSNCSTGPHTSIPIIQISWIQLYEDIYILWSSEDFTAMHEFLITAKGTTQIN